MGTRPSNVSALGAIPKPNSDNIWLTHNGSSPEHNNVHSFAITQHFSYVTLDRAVSLNDGYGPCSYLWLIYDKDHEGQWLIYIGQNWSDAWWGDCGANPWEPRKVTLMPLTSCHVSIAWTSLKRQGMETLETLTTQKCQSPEFDESDENASCPAKWKKLMVSIATKDYNKHNTAKVCCYCVTNSSSNPGHNSQESTTELAKVSKLFLAVDSGVSHWQKPLKRTMQFEIMCLYGRENAKYLHRRMPSVSYQQALRIIKHHRKSLGLESWKRRQEGHRSTTVVQWTERGYLFGKGIILQRKKRQI